MDPVIVQPRTHPVYDLVKGALQRRDRWASREEALRLLQANPFFGAWHPSVLQAYVEYGLTPVPPPKGGVKLKMPGVQEAICFADMITACEVWELIEGLDERIALRWVIPGKGGIGAQSVGGGGEYARVRVWRRPKNSSNVAISNAGHLVSTLQSRQPLCRCISC